MVDEMTDEIATVSTIIIDNEELMRQVVGTALMSLGCDIVGEAAHGRDGIDLFVRTSPDLVLLDMRMPVMGGMETLKALLAKDPDAYIVMLTAVDDADAIEECVIAGAKDYIRKGMPIDKMIERLQKHVIRLRGVETATAG